MTRVAHSAAACGKQQGMVPQVQAEFETHQRAHEQVVDQSNKVLAQFNDLQAGSPDVQVVVLGYLSIYCPYVCTP